MNEKSNGDNQLLFEIALLKLTSKLVASKP